MEEPRRFIRYSLPGLVFSILLLVTFILLQFDHFLKILSGEKLKEIAGIGTAVGAFIVLGGLGYIFSIIYFGFFWLFSIAGFHIDNHLTTIQELINFNKLQILKLVKGKENIYDLNGRRKDGWYIVNIYFQSRIKQSKSIEGIVEKLDTYYSNITTSLGTTIVATVFSYVIFVGLVHSYYINISCSTVVLCHLIYIVFLIFVTINFRKTRKAYEDMINIAFVTEVINEVERSGMPVKIFYSKG